MKGKILIFAAFVALCISSCNAVTGVLYERSGGAAVNWNPNLVDPIFGLDYFSQPGNDTANNFFTVNVDLSTTDTVTIEFWTTPIGVGDYAFALNPQIPVFYGNPSSYFAIALPNGVYRGGNQGPFATLLTSSGNVTCTAASGVRSEISTVHVSLTLTPGTSNSILRIRTYDPLTPPNVWKDTCVTTFDAPILPNAITGVKEFKFGSHSFGANTIFKNYPGSIDELRIWSIVRSAATLDAEANTVLSGNENGLLAYFRMNTANTFFTDSSVNNRIGISSADPPVWIDPSIAIDESISMYAPVWNIYKEILPTQNHTTEWMFYQQNTGLPPNYLQLVTNPTNNLNLCVGNITNPSSYGPCATYNGNNVVTTFFYLSLIPTRGACNSTESFQIQARTSTGGVNSFNNPTVTLNIQGLPTLSLTSTQQQLTTEGGIVTFSGTSLGRDEVLDATEYARLVRRGGNGETINCLTPSVTATGTNLVCGVAPGVGQFDLQISLCKQTRNYPLAFSFYAPNVDSLGGNDFTSISLFGDFFGPARTWTAPYDQVRVSNATVNFACNVIANNHTFITCTAPNGTLFVDRATYTVNVTVGGQSHVSSQLFTLCIPPCLNNGTCLNNKQCDCSRTGYEGADCSQLLVCSPVCKNGICIRGSDGVKQCSCNDGWTATDCSQSVIDSRNNTPAIAGGSAAGGVVIIALVVAVIILATRKPKRGTKNFIPVEKKDFTKIIYGEQLSQSPEKNVGDLKALEQLLIQDNLELAFAISNITQITEADKIAKAMVVVFEENKKVLHLLEAFISDEVRNTEQAGTLFRSNSMVSKMFKFYSRLIGLPYLYTTIGPEIDELIFEELGLEVDPEKMEEGADLDEMRWTLMAQSQKILKSILNTVENCPAQFRSLFSHIKKCVSERFPDNVNTTIGGFIFLRFFCPAVSSPEAYGIVEEPPSASARRLLILITKVLQNLSNDVEFGSKEPYMTKMNDFIQSNRVKLVTFYDKLVKPSTKPPVTTEMPKNIKPVSLAVLSAHIRENINKFENQDLKKKLQEITKEN